MAGEVVVVGPIQGISADHLVINHHGWGHNRNSLRRGLARLCTHFHSLCYPGSFADEYPYRQYYYIPFWFYSAFELSHSYRFDYSRMAVLRDIDKPFNLSGLGDGLLQRERGLCLHHGKSR
jgi:hypothetical protein